MGAIAGILRLDDQREVMPTLRSIAAQLGHRAPDGVRFSAVDGFGLAHGALHSTPESVLERQPVAIGERWMLAVDGRIDNRDALARQLGIDGAELAGLGDDALFARAWSRWGQDLWRHVVGEFALAVWDRQERCLALLRDRVGQRPLYYARSGSLLAFASEPEPLLGLEGISRACDQDALAYLLSDSFQPEDRGATFYRDVRRILPGEALHASAAGDVRLVRYWSMQPDRELRLRNPCDYVDAFREVFGEAVRCRLRSLQRPALMLSGGIDSASVLGAARLMGGDALALRPISMVADPGQACDETSNILRMHGGSDGVRIPVAHLSGLPESGALVEAAWKQAHPIDNSLLYARLVHLVAKAAGSHIVIDGADGDVIMHADAYYAGRLALSGHPIQAWKEARLSSQVHTYLRGIPPRRILLRGMAATLQPTWLAVLRYRLHDDRRGDDVLGAWIDAGFARRLRLRERRLGAAIAERRARGSRAANLVASWWGPGITRSLEGADRTAACFGIEARHPWCDQRVLEFFLNLPEEYVTREGWTKWIARSAYASALDDEVVWHSGKSHLGSQVTRYLLRASSDQVTELLGRAGECLGGIVDARALENLLSAWHGRDAEPDRVAIDDVLLISTLVAWMQRFGLRAG